MLRQDEIENNMANLINRPNKVDGHFSHGMSSEELFHRVDAS